MTTPQWVQDLDEERWQWQWPGYLPRRVLVDAFAEALAARQGAVWNDYDNIDPSELPFRAYELDAIAWESGGTIQAQRNALKRARELNDLIGTEEAFYILLELNRTTGFHRYRPDGAKTVQTLTGIYTGVTATAPTGAGQIRLNGDSLEIWPANAADRTALEALRAAALIEFDTDNYVQFRENPDTTGNVITVDVDNPASSVVPMGNLSLDYHGPYTGVELWITPPIDRAFDADFLLYITDRATRVWPHTLRVIAVHILSVSSTNYYLQTAQYSRVLSGWPGGV